MYAGTSHEKGDGFITSTNTRTECNAFMNYYKKAPTCFGTEMPSSGGHLIQRTHQSIYYVAFAEIIKILELKNMKCINE
jgi:hypothetical protein